MFTMNKFTVWKKL